MDQQQCIEFIQDAYPNSGETMIRILLNQGQRKFIEKAPVLSRHDATVTFIANQRHYAFSDFANITNDDDVIEVTQIDLAEVPINRLIGEPSISDVT